MPIRFGTTGKRLLLVRKQQQQLLCVVASFGLLSIASLPISLWIALYSYSYVNRVSLCCQALTTSKQYRNYR